MVGPAEPLFVVAGEDLILPCYIKPNLSAVDMRVEWFRLDLENSVVHLYKDREDKNIKQIQSYRGRTALFEQELQKGNASLKLTKVRVTDEGFYKCLIESKSWYDDITVNVKVEGKHTIDNWFLTGLLTAPLFKCSVSLVMLLKQNPQSQQQCHAFPQKRISRYRGNNVIQLLLSVSFTFVLCSYGNSSCDYNGGL